MCAVGLCDANVQTELDRVTVVAIPKEKAVQIWSFLVFCGTVFPRAKDGIAASVHTGCKQLTATDIPGMSLQLSWVAGY
jgi:hypothetical protein